MLNAGTVLKPAWGFVAGGASGCAAVGPALAALAFCNTVVAWAIHREPVFGDPNKEAGQ